MSPRETGLDRDTSSARRRVSRCDSRRALTLGVRVGLRQRPTPRYLAHAQEAPHGTLTAAAATLPLQPGTAMGRDGTLRGSGPLLFGLEHRLKRDHSAAEGIKSTARPSFTGETGSLGPTGRG